MNRKGGCTNLSRFPLGVITVLSLATISGAVSCFDFNNYSLQGYAGTSGDDAGPDEDADLGDSGGECVAPVATGLCGTYPQCGCGMLQVCDVRDTTGTTACIPDRGLTAGQACGAMFSGCSAGLSCVDGTCKKFCKISRHCEKQGACVSVPYLSDGVEYQVTNMRVCTDQCDLMQPAVRCGKGTGCYPRGQVGDAPGYTLCKVSQFSNTDCKFNQDCAPGLGCGEDLRCHPWCRSGVPLECTPPQTCRMVKVDNKFGYYFVGDDSYGMCK